MSLNSVIEVGVVIFRIVTHQEELKARDLSNNKHFKMNRRQKWLPHNLTEDQQLVWFNTCYNMHQQVDTNVNKVKNALAVCQLP